MAVQFPGVGKPGTCACIALSPIISLADYCNWTIWLRKELRNRIICMIDCNGQPVILLSIPLPRSYDFLVSSCSKKKGFAFLAPLVLRASFFAPIFEFRPKEF